MGVYLPKPKTDKDAADGGDLEVDSTRYGVCAMQGWRQGMEDAHLTLPLVKCKLGEEASPPIGVYGVFDGHGGPAVSEWISRHFVTVMEKSVEEAALAGEPKNAVSKDLPPHVQLICNAMAKTFLNLDAALNENEHRKELKEIHDGFLEAQKKGSTLLQEMLDGVIPPPPFVRIFEENGRHVLQIVRPEDGSGDDEEDAEEDKKEDVMQIEEVTESSEDESAVEKAAEPMTDEAQKKETTVAPKSTATTAASTAAPSEAEHPVADGPPKKTDDDKLGKENKQAGTLETPVEGSPMKDVSPPTSPASSHAASPEIELSAEVKDAAAFDEYDSTDAMLDDVTAVAEEDNRNRMDSNTPEGCGAAVIVAAVIGGESPYLVAANAGDSRCVLSRDGTAVPMSEDHKPGLDRETRRIVNAGGTILSGRVDGNLNLSRTVGDLFYKKNDRLGPEAQKLTAYPDIRVIPISPKDEFAILACDGIWDCVSNQEAVDFVREQLVPGADGSVPTLSQISAKMCDNCLATNPFMSDGGIGCDNMTFVIVLFGPQLKKHAEPPAGEPVFYNEQLYEDALAGAVAAAEQRQPGEEKHDSTTASGALPEMAGGGGLEPSAAAAAHPRPAVAAATPSF